MNESQIRSLRLTIAAQLLSGSDVIGGATNGVNARISAALLVAEALIKANHETPVTFVVPPATEEEKQAVYRSMQSPLPWSVAAQLKE
jgi:hypothetical protein